MWDILSMSNACTLQSQNRLRGLKDKTSIKIKHNIKSGGLSGKINYFMHQKLVLIFNSNVPVFYHELSILVRTWCITFNKLCFILITVMKLQIWFRSLDEEINHSRKTGACPGNLLRTYWTATDRAGLKYIPNFILGSQEPGSDQLLINMQMVWFLAESDYCC